MSVALVAFVVLLLLSAPMGRRGGGTNDLRRWKQFGGTLDRPAPPAKKRGAA